MNQAFIDNAILLIAALTALLIIRFTKQRNAGRLSSFLLLLSPLIIFLNMFAHTVAVLVVNLKRYQAGSFQYNFHFYSLMLFGIVFMVVSSINISCARKRIKGDLEQKSRMLWLNLGTALLFLPLIFINPIALLPVLASILSSVTLILMKPIRNAEPVIRSRHRTILFARQSRLVN